jgi:hypothetical protein
MTSLETIDLTEAAALLHMSEDALMRKARAGIVPGSKPGRRWVFIKEDLFAWLKAQQKVCRSTNVGVSGGSALAARLASQRAQRIGERRKNSSASSPNDSGDRRSSETVVPFPGQR